MPAIHENEPKPGWYMRRLIPKGPYVPARIWLDVELGDDGELLGPEVLLCEVDGQRRNVGSEWTWLASHPISEDRYMDMIAGNFTSSAPGAVDEVITPEKATAPPGVTPEQPLEKPVGTLF